jgi:GDPmannose 4,6-dehydratase
MKKALVTGITGQDGPYLAKLLLEKDYQIYGLVRRQAVPRLDNLKYLGIDGQVEIIMGDMTDEVSLINIIKKIQPDEVYNLAGQSYVACSWEQPELTMDVNAMGVLNMLNALKIIKPDTKFYQASTSEMFGNSNEHGLQTEQTPFNPRSPYAISKLAAYWLANNFKESYGMFCCNGILFNHESPIRGREFVTRKISEGVAKIKLGLASEIRLGNLDSKRDWGFAGDYVDAMWRMMQYSKPDNYIVSTGETHSIKDFLEAAFRYVQIEDFDRYIQIDPRFQRPAELFVLQGRCDKAKTTLGWRPKVKFQELVEMMVDADLKRLSLNQKL